MKHFMKKHKKFIKIFLISFAATAAVTCFMLFVLFRGIFYNIYKGKGNGLFEKGMYTESIEQYNTAKKWKGKKQEIYLLIAKSYCEMENFDSALEIIDDAIKNKVTTADNGLEDLYAMRIQVMSASGNLSAAAQYINSIDDQYILKKIEQMRPADLSYTPTQGNYDKTLKMEIKVREGETVYYTTDGTYPTKFSNLYVQPINIGNGKTNITAVSVNAMGLVSPLLSVTYEVTNENEPVSFDDEKIEKMVRVALSKPNGVVRVKELESITALDNFGIDGYVRTLSDLDLMPNLESLVLDGETNLLSLSQISGKTKLNFLSLCNCSLDSTEITVLGGLPALQTLYLTNNDISSISVLSNIATLTDVNIAENNITDLTPLSAQTGLVSLDASNNRISELPDFASSAKLEILTIANNSVTDLSSAHNLSALTYLDITNNLVKNAKTLGALTKLQSLYIGSNPVTNFDFIKEMTSLVSLDVSNTSFVNTSVIKDRKFNYFCADNTGISSVEDLAASTELITLSIANTNVTELAPLKSLTLLDYLDISNCEIDDIGVLSQFPALYTLCAENVDTNGLVLLNPNAMIVQ